VNFCENHALLQRTNICESYKNPIITKNRDPLFAIWRVSKCYLSLFLV